MAFPSRRAPTSFAHSFKGYGGQCGFGDSGSAAKNYRIDIPVFAGPPSTTQDAWNKQTADFSCSINGEIKKFQIKMNLANVANGLHIYPIPDAKKTEDSFFPANTWGFAITPRNYKQFNYQLLMDALIWNKYRVDSCRLQWQPCLGSFKAGQIEAILVSDAQSMPPEPYSNQGNSYVFSATTGAGVAFNISNLQQPIKSTRSVEDTWSIAADYGILYIRADGYSDLTAITKVGTISLNIGVTLFGYSPDPKAQLIGPWIEAGYPIEGSAQTKSVGEKAASACFINVESSNALDEAKVNAKKRRKEPKGWRMITEVGAEPIPCAGFHTAMNNKNALAHRKAIMLRRGRDAADGVDELINSVTDTFDFGLTGKYLIEGLGHEESTVYADKYSDSFLRFAGGDLIIEGIDNASIVFKPTGAVNAHALAQGLLSVPYSTTSGTENYVAQGAEVGFTTTTITAFEPTCKPPSAGGALNQLAFGYDPAIGNAVSGEVKTASDGVLGKALAVLSAGLNKLVSGTLGAETYNENSAVSQGVESDDKALTTAEGNAVEAQSLRFVVPPEATVRSTMAKWDDGSTNKRIAEMYFKPLEGASGYGVKTYESSAMGPEVSRITVNGQVNTLISAFMGVQGTSSASVSTADIDVSNLFVLAASRYSPLEDMNKFIETAIPITPLTEGVSQGHSSVSLNNLTGDTKLSFKVQTSDSGASNNVKNYSQLGSLGFGICAFPSVVNFSMPYPDKLITDKGDDEYELTELKEGEVFYCMVIKGSRISFSHTVNESAGTFRFSVAPGMVNGADKAPADQALHQYTLTKNDDNIVIDVKEGGALAATPYFQIDTERRFAIQSSKPADSV
jgi:hypothetical protein